MESVPPECWLLLRTHSGTSDFLNFLSMCKWTRDNVFPKAIPSLVFLDCEDLRTWHFYEQIEFFQGKMPVSHFPPNVKRVILNTSKSAVQSLDILPTSVEYLLINGYDHFNTPLNDLPPRLQMLMIGGNTGFNQPVDRLPKTLRVLNLFCINSFNQPLDRLPPNLEELRVYARCAFNQPIDKLPTTLKKVVIKGINVNFYK